MVRRSSARRLPLRRVRVDPPTGDDPDPAADCGPTTEAVDPIDAVRSGRSGWPWDLPAVEQLVAEGLDLAG